MANNKSKSKPVWARIVAVVLAFGMLLSSILVMGSGGSKQEVDTYPEISFDSIGTEVSSGSEETQGIIDSDTPQEVTDGDIQVGNQ